MNKRGFETMLGVAPKAMPTVALVVLILTLPCSAEQPPDIRSSLSVASLDIGAFFEERRSDEEVRQLCEVVRRFDLTALQGVRDARILTRTVGMLKDRFGQAYRFLASPGPGAGGGPEEKYAFLWKTDRVEYSGLSGVYLDPENALSSDPFFGLFQAGEFDFYAISVRLDEKKPVEERRAEALLLGGVYRFVQDLDGENDVLMAGSFSLPPDDPGFASLWAVPTMVAVNEGHAAPTRGRAEDNIWFQTHFTDEYTGRSGVMELEEAIPGYGSDSASKILDHRPVWAVFDVTEGDG